MFGIPFPLSRRSFTPVAQLIVNPSGGVNYADAPTDVDPSQSPDCDNFIFRYNALQPRPLLSPSLENATPGIPGSPILGGKEVTDVFGNTYPLASNKTQLVWYSEGSWSVLSYVSAYGVNAQPAGSATDYWDVIDTYFDQRDENIAVLANNSYQTLYCWQSNTTVFSSLTGAPMARVVESFNNYLLAANVKSGSSVYVQRIQWSDRGSASSWTGGLSGFEDLLSMHGQITRLMGQENRVVVMSDQEIWQGLPVDYPYIFNFQPLDRNVGCPYPWTATVTPAGIFFLGTGLQVYWLPKTGGPAQPIGHKVLKFLRDNIDVPERSWGVYDSTYNQYQLYYPIQSGSGYPQRALFLNIGSDAGAEAGAWGPQSFDLSGGQLNCSRGFEANKVTSSGTTWGGAGSLTWAQANLQWNQIGGTSYGRAVHLGTSAGSLAFYGTANTGTDPSTPVLHRWRSLAYGGNDPTHEKTLLELRLDYQADAPSTITVRTSADQGGTFDTGVRVELPACSQQSQVRAFVYASARYPMWEILTEDRNFKLLRMYASMKPTGR